MTAATLAPLKSEATRKDSRVDQLANVCERFDVVLHGRVGTWSPVVREKIAYQHVQGPALALLGELLERAPVACPSKEQRSWISDRAQSSRFSRPQPHA